MKKKAVALALSLMMTAGALTGCGGNSAETQEPEQEKTEQETETADGEAAAEEETEEAADDGTDMKIPDEITVYTYYADASVQVVDGTVERLNEIYPDLKINIEHRTDSDGAVLKTRAAVGELPDIFECTGQLTDILRESGDLAVLDDVIEQTGPEGCLVFYNTEVFEQLGLEEPKNYDEFKEVVKTLADNDIIPLALFAQQKWPGLQMFDMAVVGQGQPLGLTGLEDGTTSITDPEYLEAAKKIEELVSLGLIGKGALNTNASQAFELVGTGQAGMLINGSWFFDDAIAGGYAVSAKGEYAEFCKQVVVDWVYCRSLVSAEIGKITALKDPAESKDPRPASYQDFADHVADIKSTTKFEWALNNQELIVALEDTSELLNTGSYSAEDFNDDLDVRISEALGE